jgi:hydrogenase maturation protease
MKVLVAGVGNVFLGVEVVRRLAERPLPEGVQLADYGIRGMHLAYDLAGGAYDTTILIDAVATGEPPGTVSVIELDPAEAPAAELLDAHGMQPDVVLGLVALLGEQPGKVLLVGCEPAVIDHGMELSPPVAQAVGAAVDTTLELLTARQVGG